MADDVVVVKCCLCTTTLKRVARYVCTDCVAVVCVQCFQFGAEGTAPHKRGHNYEIRYGDSNSAALVHRLCARQQEEELIQIVHSYKPGKWEQVTIEILKGDWKKRNAADASEASAVFSNPRTPFRKETFPFCESNDDFWWDKMIQQPREKKELERYYVEENVCTEEKCMAEAVKNCNLEGVFKMKKMFPEECGDRPNLPVDVKREVLMEAVIEDEQRMRMHGNKAFTAKMMQREEQCDLVETINEESSCDEGQDYDQEVVEEQDEEEPEDEDQEEQGEGSSVISDTHSDSDAMEQAYFDYERYETRMRESGYGTDHLYEDWTEENYSDAEQIISRLNIVNNDGGMANDMENEIKLSKVDSYIRVLQERRAQRNQAVEYESIPDFLQLYRKMHNEKRKLEDLVKAAEESPEGKLKTILSRDELAELDATRTRALLASTASISHATLDATLAASAHLLQAGLTCCGVLVALAMRAAVASRAAQLLEEMRSSSGGDFGEERRDGEEFRSCAMEALEIPVAASAEIELTVGGGRGARETGLARLFTPTPLLATVATVPLSGSGRVNGRLPKFNWKFPHRRARNQPERAQPPPAAAAPPVVAPVVEAARPSTGGSTTPTDPAPPQQATLEDTILRIMQEQGFIAAPRRAPNEEYEDVEGVEFGFEQHNQEAEALEQPGDDQPAAEEPNTHEAEAEEIPEDEPSEEEQNAEQENVEEEQDAAEDAPDDEYDEYEEWQRHADDPVRPKLLQDDHNSRQFERRGNSNFPRHVHEEIEKMNAETAEHGNPLVRPGPIDAWDRCSKIPHKVSPVSYDPSLTPSRVCASLPSPLHPSPVAYKLDDKLRLTEQPAVWRYPNLVHTYCTPIPPNPLEPYCPPKSATAMDACYDLDEYVEEPPLVPPYTPAYTPIHKASRYAKMRVFEIYSRTANSMFKRALEDRRFDLLAQMDPFIVRFPWNSNFWISPPHVARALIGEPLEPRYADVFTEVATQYRSLYSAEGFVIQPGMLKPAAAEWFAQVEALAYDTLKWFEAMPTEWARNWFLHHCEQQHRGHRFLTATYKSDPREHKRQYKRGHFVPLPMRYVLFDPDHHNYDPQQPYKRDEAELPHDVTYASAYDPDYVVFTEPDPFPTYPGETTQKELHTAYLRTRHRIQPEMSIEELMRIYPCARPDDPTMPSGLEDLHARCILRRYQWVKPDPANGSAPGQEERRHQQQQLAVVETQRAPTRVRRVLWQRSEADTLREASLMKDWLTGSFHPFPYDHVSLTKQLTPFQLVRVELMKEWLAKQVGKEKKKIPTVEPADGDGSHSSEDDNDGRSTANTRPQAQCEDYVDAMARVKIEHVQHLGAPAPDRKKKDDPKKTVAKPIAKASRVVDPLGPEVSAAIARANEATQARRAKEQVEHARRMELAAQQERAALERRAADQMELAERQERAVEERQAEHVRSRVETELRLRARDAERLESAARDLRRRRIRPEADADFQELQEQMRSREQTRQAFLARHAPARQSAAQPRDMPRNTLEDLTHHDDEPMLLATGRPLSVQLLRPSTSIVVPPTRSSTIVPPTRSTLIPPTSSTLIPTTRSSPFVPPTRSTLIPPTSSTLIPTTRSSPFVPPTRSTLIPPTSSTLIPTTRSSPFVPPTSGGPATAAASARARASAIEEEETGFNQLVGSIGEQEGTFESFNETHRRALCEPAAPRGNNLVVLPQPPAAAQRRISPASAGAPSVRNQIPRPRTDHRQRHHASANRRGDLHRTIPSAPRRVAQPASRPHPVILDNPDQLHSHPGHLDEEHRQAQTRQLRNLLHPIVPADEDSPTYEEINEAHSPPIYTPRLETATPRDSNVSVVPQAPAALLLHPRPAFSPPADDSLRFNDVFPDHAEMPTLNDRHRERAVATASTRVSIRSGFPEQHHYPQFGSEHAPPPRAGVSRANNRMPFDENAAGPSGLQRQQQQRQRQPDQEDHDAYLRRMMVTRQDSMRRGDWVVGTGDGGPIPNPYRRPYDNENEAGPSGLQQRQRRWSDEEEEEEEEEERRVSTGAQARAARNNLIPVNENAPGPSGTQQQQREDEARRQRGVAANIAHTIQTTRPDIGRDSHARADPQPAARNNPGPSGLQQRQRTFSEEEALICFSEDDESPPGPSVVPQAVPKLSDAEYKKKKKEEKKKYNAERDRRMALADELELEEERVRQEERKKKKKDPLVHRISTSVLHFTRQFIPRKLLKASIPKAALAAQANSKNKRVILSAFSVVKWGKKQQKKVHREESRARYAEDNISFMEEKYPAIEDDPISPNPASAARPLIDKKYNPCEDLALPPFFPFIPELLYLEKVRHIGGMITLERLARCAISMGVNFDTDNFDRIRDLINTAFLGHPRAVLPHALPARFAVDYTVQADGGHPLARLAGSLAPPTQDVYRAAPLYDTKKFFNLKILHMSSRMFWRESYNQPDTRPMQEQADKVWYAFLMASNRTSARFLPVLSRRQLFVIFCLYSRIDKAWDMHAELRPSPKMRAFIVALLEHPTTIGILKNELPRCLMALKRINDCARVRSMAAFRLDGDQFLDTLVNMWREFDNPIAAAMPTLDPAPDAPNSGCASHNQDPVAHYLKDEERVETFDGYGVSNNSQAAKVDRIIDRMVKYGQQGREDIDSIIGNLLVCLKLLGSELFPMPGDFDFRAYQIIQVGPEFAARWAMEGSSRWYEHSNGAYLKDLWDLNRDVDVSRGRNQGTRRGRRRSLSESAAQSLSSTTRSEANWQQCLSLPLEPITPKDNHPLWQLESAQHAQLFGYRPAPVVDIFDPMMYKEDSNGHSLELNVKEWKITVDAASHAEPNRHLQADCLNWYDRRATTLIELVTNHEQGDLRLHNRQFARRTRGNRNVEAPLDFATHHFVRTYRAYERRALLDDPAHVQLNRPPVPWNVARRVAPPQPRVAALSVPSIDPPTGQCSTWDFLQGFKPAVAFTEKEKADWVIAQNRLATPPMQPLPAVPARAPPVGRNILPPNQTHQSITRSQPVIPEDVQMGSEEFDAAEARAVRADATERRYNQAGSSLQGTTRGETSGRREDQAGSSESGLASGATSGTRANQAGSSVRGQAGRPTSLWGEYKIPSIEPNSGECSTWDFLQGFTSAVPYTKEYKTELVNAQNLLATPPRQQPLPAAPVQAAPLGRNIRPTTQPHRSISRSQPVIPEDVQMGSDEFDAADARAARADATERRYNQAGPTARDTSGLSEEQGSSARGTTR